MGEKTILVVESDRAILTLLTVAWSSEGYTVLPAASGRGALFLAGQRRPDVIVVDLTAPDGVDLCWRFRTAAPTAATPIVALVDEDEPSGGVSSPRAPVKTSVPMPFDLAQLSRVVTRLADGLSLPTGARVEM